MSTTTDTFYRDLPAFDDFDGIARHEHYHRVPDDWLVVVTDVAGSTKAIEAGRYKEVNALGVASIVAVLNAVGELDVPYVFGGDGATMLVPPGVEAAVRQALVGVGLLARQAFELELRVGLVPVAEVRRRGGELTVARYQASEHVCLAMLSGGGAELAERLVKSGADDAAYCLELPDHGDAHSLANLEGFQCRWKPLESRNGKTVSVLAVALDATEQARSQTYRRLLEAIDELGEVDELRPASRANTRLGDDTATMDVEGRMRTGKPSGLRLATYKLKTALQVRVGRRAMRTGKTIAGFDGARYPDQVIANTDFRKFDDALRMVLDLTDEQHARLEALLTAERAAGHIAWGTHAAEAALMTCLVFSYDGDHVHFIDGADGGYALAAKQLKAQLAASS